MVVKLFLFIFLLTTCTNFAVRPGGPRPGGVTKATPPGPSPGPGPSTSSSDCSLDVIGLDEAKSPLLFNDRTTHFELIVPDKGKVKLMRGRGIIIACPGTQNALTTINSASTLATCDSGDMLIIGNSKHKFSNIKCNKAIKGDVLSTQQRCALNKGLIKEIGYQVTQQRWVPLIKVCYDENTAVTFYTEHTLYKDAIAYSSRSKSSGSTFRIEGLGAGIKPRVAFMQSGEQTVREVQWSTFMTFLGPTLARNYINPSSFLARGHLSPRADFFLTATQESSCYIINICFQWQAINGGNWKQLEAAVRKASAKSTLSVVTGTHGVLSFPGMNGDQREIYLARDTLPIPKYIWKIVYSQDTKMGIAFVVLNNPFSTRPTVDPRDIFCHNICRANGWGSGWTDQTRGFIFCCELSDFQKSVKTAPWFPVSGVLQG